MQRVRIGVIGAGWWATSNHIPLLAQRKDVDLVAVCRLGKEKLGLIQEKFGFRFATEDYRELLQQDLDGVIVTSSHDLHYEHARAALERGLHVMCEKPMTLHGQEAWALVRLAEEKGLHLMVPYGWNYKPFVQEAKKWIDQGAVGNIEYVFCHMASPLKGFFAGTRQVPQDEPALSVPESRTWRQREHGGGYAHGQLPHSTGLLFWLTPLRAKTVTALVNSSNLEIDMYDGALVQFQKGSLGTISGAATLPDNDPYQVDIRVFGDQGVMLLDVEAGRERAVLRRHDGRRFSVNVPSGDGTYTCEGPPNRFVDLIQGKGLNQSPGEVGARSVELIEALVASAAQQGQPVSISSPA